MDRRPILDVRVSQRIRKLAPIHEPDDDEDTYEAEQRDRALAHEKSPVGPIRKTPDEHVLGIAGERSHTADIRRSRQGDRYGTGGNASRRVMPAMSGASTRQTTSFTKSAERTPAAAMTTAS